MGLIKFRCPESVPSKCPEKCPTIGRISSDSLRELSGDSHVEYILLATVPREAKGKFEDRKFYLNESRGSLLAKTGSVTKYNGQIH